MNKKQAEWIKAAIDRTSIPEEMSALYVLANSVDMICHNVFQRIKSVYRVNGFVLKDNDNLAGISQYCDMVRRAAMLFQTKIEPRVVNATFKVSGAKGYDGFQDDSRELCQLALLYLDRTARNNEGCEKVFQTLRELPEGKLFSDADVLRYEKHKV